MCESRSAAAGANSLLAGQKGCSLLKTEVIINQETRAAGGSAKVTRKSASSDLTALLTKFLLGLYQALMRSQWAPAYFYFCNTWRSYRNALERLVTKFSCGTRWHCHHQPNNRGNGGYQTTKLKTVQTSWETEVLGKLLAT